MSMGSDYSSLPGASGVSRSKDVPKSWGTRKLRHILRRRTERNRPDQPLLSVTRQEGVILRDTTSTEDNRNYIPDDLTNYKVVHNGQFVINKMKAWQGSYGVSGYDGIVSPAYFVFDLFGVDASFFHVAIRSLAYVPAFTRASDGVRIGQWDLAEERMREIPFLVPPSVEQRAIVRFLDHADMHIRSYILAKQKLIALLEEQKQAIIHQAVTGQIDLHTGQRYVAYKPTREGWLQEVPAHWEIVELRRKWRVIDCKHVTVPFVDNGIPLASVRESQSFELTLETANHTTPEWYEKLIEGGRKPRPGDLIYCRNVSVGSAAFVATERRFAMGQDVCLIRSSSENQRWLNYFLHSKAMLDQLALILIGSTFSRINVADIKSLVIAVPPVSEQDLIAAVLDDELSKINAAIATCRREHSLLHEYRARLIADVVTGKLDVRSVTVQPEEDSLGNAGELKEDSTVEREVTV